MASQQSSRGYASYAACYQPGFRGAKRTPDGKSSTYGYDSWPRDRRKMILQTRGLNVQVEDLKVSPGATGQTATVSFVQYFSTSRYRDRGEKTMSLRMRDGRSIIDAEEMVWASTY